MKKEEERKNKEETMAKI